MEDAAIGEVLVPEQDLQRRVAELGAEVSRDYEGRTPLLVAILKGAVPFLADLMRNLTVDCELDFMAVSSYGSSTDSSGVVRILKDLDASIAGRDVLIVEDIIDSGLTLQYLLRNLRAREPNSIAVCAPAHQARAQAVDLPVRYVGSRFRTGSRSDTGSISPSGTATSPTSRPCGKPSGALKVLVPRHRSGRACCAYPPGKGLTVRRFFRSAAFRF